MSMQIIGPGGCTDPPREVPEWALEEARLERRRKRIRYRLACAGVCAGAFALGVMALPVALLFPWALLAWPPLLWVLYRVYVREFRRRFPFTWTRFPAVKRVFPQLITNEIVEVQPMTAPTGALFYLDFVEKEPEEGGDRGKKTSGRI